MLNKKIEKKMDDKNKSFKDRKQVLNRRAPT